MLQRLKEWARRIKRDIHALYLAARDPRTPWYAKSLAFGVVAYALSPIDLIPDFIPVLGYLDDAILLPLAITLVIRLVPDEVMIEHRAAAYRAEDRPVGKAGAIAVIAIWLAVVASLAFWLWPHRSN